MRNRLFSLLRLLPGLLLLAGLTACSSPYKVHKKPAKMTAKPLIGIHLKKSDCNCH